MFYHFLWNGEGDKIKRKVMINEPEYGGLKMIDLYPFNKCLKTTWVKKYLDATKTENGTLSLIYNWRTTAAISFSVVISTVETQRL